MAKTTFYSLAALIRKILFCHSKIKFISSRHRVISSIYLLDRHIQLQITAVARWLFRCENTFDFAGGRGGGWHGCFKLFVEYYTYFSRLVKVIIRILQPFLCFSVIRIYLVIFLTSWIFILLLVFSLLRYSLLVTALLCLVTPPKNAEEERKLIENGSPESTIRLKKYSSKKFFWNGWMVGNKNPVLEPCVPCCVYTTGKSWVHRLNTAVANMTLL